jgi:hypothetical protein
MVNSCPCQPESFPFVCPHLRKSMTPWLVHLCQTRPDYRQLWEDQRDNARPQLPAYIICPHRGRVLEEVNARKAGCGCASSTVQVFECRHFQEPVLRSSPARCTASIRELIPAYTGRTCRECLVPQKE